MSLRAVPNGDEQDKDIALAIRYAVDNGAKIINMSFGKSFSPGKKWIDEAELCLKYCHLTSEDSICFNHQIKKCKGICAEEEEIESYNKRAQEILDIIIFRDQHFALVDHGKSNDERSLILIENGHYAGYGYIDKTDTFSSLDECKGHIKKSVFYPDADDLIRGFLKNNRLKTIVFKEDVNN